MFKTTMTILLICFLLAACATLPAAQPPATATPPPPSATPAIEPASELPAEAAILYRRSGGIAFRDEVWTIYPDGRVTKVINPQGEGPEKEWQVPAADVAALISRLAELGFFELTGSYMPLDTCCDRITYDIEARRGEQVNHVVTLDAAPDVPDEVWQAIDALNAFIAQFEN